MNATSEPNWERTGRKRYVHLSCFVDTFRPLCVQVEETAHTAVGGVNGWETRWRFASPEDLPGDTIIGLSDT
jgi:hypothetical protein